MIEVSILGEPSPKDISIELSGMTGPVQMVDRYPGELRDIYRLGYYMGANIFYETEAVVKDVIDKTLGLYFPEQGDLIGPSVDESGLVTRGLAVWHKRTRQPS